MKEVLFIGPVAMTGGPAIKNRILVKYLQQSTALKIWNTYDKSIKARVGAIISILFSNKNILLLR